ncbi:hypothetical protein F9948_30460, partial [Burkholderia thailandensis]|nr:hypothetical protein [Burkholderia thailandensis]MDD1490463.1 hypothetical protein [Burkholderia thailandensis]MDD1496528.1 hypothetical protein [Burkholderia thailandensis]
SGSCISSIPRIGLSAQGHEHDISNAPLAKPVYTVPKINSLLGPVHADSGLAPAARRAGREGGWGAANTRRIRRIRRNRKEHGAAIGPSGGQPRESILRIRGTGLAGRIAASRVACLARPNGGSVPLALRPATHVRKPDICVNRP